MKHFLTPFLAILIFLGCRPSQTSDNRQVDSENDIGELISTIEFQVEASEEDKKIFEDGIIPWISLNTPEREVDKLIMPDEIVIPYSEITLIIDYPLSNPATFKMSATGKGFTRKQLIMEVSKKYHEIYEEEESSATIKTTPMEERQGLINRNQTDGKYGIWGHDLSDLDLSTIEVYKNKENIIYITLGVES